MADEIIVVDSSVEDNTTKIVESLAEHNGKIKHIRFYWQGANAFALSCHIGLVIQLQVDFQMGQRLRRKKQRGADGLDEQVKAA